MKQHILREEQVGANGRSPLLADSLELAKTTELLARELSAMAEAFALKYQQRLAEVRREVGQK